MSLWEFKNIKDEDAEKLKNKWAISSIIGFLGIYSILFWKFDIIIALALTIPLMINWFGFAISVWLFKTAQTKKRRRE